QLSPFDDPVFGSHARYLIARIHHVGGERAEAADHYEAVLTDYGKQKQAATQALNQPDKFKNDPEEKARVEALAKGPMPDHVGRALPWSGTAQVVSAHAASPQAFQQSLTAAVETFRRAAERAQQSPDADAKTRRGEILIEQAEAQQVLKLYKDAAGTYNTIL